MSKRYVLSIGLAFVFLGALESTAARSSKEVAIQSLWASTPVVIDGLAADWGDAALTTNGATKAEFAFRNDAGFLYFLLELEDPLFLSTVERSGVTVYWCPPGQSKKDNGLKFTRLVLSANQLIARRSGQGRKLSAEEVAAIKAKPMHTLLLYDMLNKKDRAKMATAKPSHYPDFNAAKEGKGWVYEFKIPLAKDENQPFGIGAEPGGTVRVGIEWGGRMEAPTQQADQFMKGLSDAIDTTRQDAQVRKGEPKYTIWVDVALAAKP